MAPLTSVAFVFPISALAQWAEKMAGFTGKRLAQAALAAALTVSLSACSSGGGGGGGGGGGATLQSIAVTPAGASLAAGLTQAYTAQGSYSDGTTSDITAQVTWGVTPGTGTASINSAGLLTTGTAGTVAVTADLDGVSGSTGLTITAAQLNSITVSPGSATLPIGLTQPLSAQGHYSDGSSPDITGSVTWSSSNTAVATVNSAGVVTATGTGTAVITATLGGVSNTSSITGSAAVLQLITLTPDPLSKPQGLTQQMTASGSYSNGSTVDITGSVTWSSGNTSIATVDSAGLATMVSPGSTTLIATLGGRSGSAALTVTAPALQLITVTPGTASLAKGLTQAFTASGSYDNGTTVDITSSVTWASSSNAIATIDGTGLATAMATGTVTLTASLSGQSGTASLTVTPAALTSIAVTPGATSLAKGLTQQLAATGTYTDATTADLTNTVSWTSSNNPAATVDASGLVTAHSTGTATLTASLSGKSGTASLTVTPAALSSIAVTPASASLPKGLTQQLTATGTYTDATTADLTNTVSWTSSDNLTATVGAAGLATAQGTGTATLTASLSGKSGSASLTVTAKTLQSIAVTPGTVTLQQGATAQLTATGTYSDNSTANLTNTVNWTSSDNLIATVDGTGLATATGQGSVTLTASLGGKSNTASVTVTGVALSFLTVTPATASLAVGFQQAFTATGTYMDGTSADVTTQVTWSATGGTGSASINAAGTATGISAGTVTITAALGGKTSTAALTVTGAALTSITLFPAATTLPAGGTQQIIATGTWSDGSSRDITSLVTWSSANTGVATVSASGLVSGIGAGTVSITATHAGSGLSKSATVSVQAASLSFITISPSSKSMAAGQTVSYTATANYSNGTSADVTSTVVWASSNTAIATVNAAGLATGVGAGTATITATLSGTSGSATLTVTSAALTGVSIVAGVTQVVAGQALALQAWGSYSDGTSGDLTHVVTWSSANTAVATISPAGVVSGLAAGSVQISAAHGGFTGTVTLTVVSATLQSIAVSPANSTLVAGLTQPLTATGVYSNGQSLDITDLVTWTTGSTATAIVDNTGLVTGVAAGSVSISASMGGFTGTANVVVNAATLSSITVSPSAFSMAAGLTRQVTATGNYSDGTSRDITPDVAWTSGNTAAAIVWADGVVTGISAGTAVITASLSGKTAASTATITNPVLNTIVVTPSSATLPVGLSKQFTATANYSNGTSADVTNQVTWTSSNNGIALDNTGLALGVAAGGVTITASLSGKLGSANLTVTAATLNSITVTPTNPQTAPGQTRQFNAMGNYSDGTSFDLTAISSWSSGSTTVATVNAQGLANALSAGGAIITASYGGVSGSTLFTVTSASLSSITVSPATVNAVKISSGGSPHAFSAFANYSDGTSVDVTTAVQWSSSNVAVATVSSTGLASGVGAGTAVITAVWLATGTSGTASMVVANATLSFITVTPAAVSAPTLANGGIPIAFTATATYSDASTVDVTSSVTWTSSNPGVATISTTGLASGVSPGTVTIDATDPVTNISGTSSTASGGSTGTLTVTAATLTGIALTPANSILPVGVQQAYTATGTYSDASTLNLTTTVNWTSSNPALASVNAAGLVTTLGAGGPVTLTATHPNIAVSGQTALTITNETLVSIAVTPSPVTLAKGQIQAMTATGTFSAGTVANLTTMVTWTSSNTALASVTSAGVVTAVGAGGTGTPVTIGAALNPVSGTGTVNVTNAIVTRVGITPGKINNLAVGNTRQMTATATFSDGTVDSVLTNFTWASSAPTVASVSASGLVTSVSASPANTCDVTATYTDWRPGSVTSKLVNVKTRL
ncbi:MAG: Ig-like domain-containing protein [Deltaproteobacteria bacterium]|nr:Ig-like domain-containing protein [Deltaproteobacteria bacterium]